jgi:hypothetical protein
MKKIYYEKKGRRYVPVAEYDNELLDSFPKGYHLVSVYPGGSSRRFNIDPNYASMIAAGRVAEDAICEQLRKQSEMKPQRTPLTSSQLKAWEQLAKELGDELCPLSYSSARDLAEAGVKAMMFEADRLMKHESVRKAYENFILMCKLTEEKGK